MNLIRKDTQGLHEGQAKINPFQDDRAQSVLIVLIAATSISEERRLKDSESCLANGWPVWTEIVPRNLKNRLGSKKLFFS